MIDTNGLKVEGFSRASKTLDDVKGRQESESPSAWRRPTSETNSIRSQSRWLVRLNEPPIDTARSSVVLIERAFRKQRENRNEGPTRFDPQK